MVLVSRDGERSMNTYLGVSEFLAPGDIDEGLMARAEWIFLEGYRFDGPDSHAAFAKAIRATRAAGGKVAITLSDPFCVERHRDAFLAMIRADVELLVANEHELKSLYLTDDLGVAMDRAEAEIPVTACTVGAGGAHILSRGERVHAPAVGTRVVDVTGAGDLFAAGLLHGLTTGRDWLTSLRMGNVAAAEVISHLGARPEADLRGALRGGGAVLTAPSDVAGTPAARGDNPRLGIALMILTTFVFACMDAVSRHLASHYSVITVATIRYWVFAAFVLATAAASPGGIRPGGAVAGAAAAGLARAAARGRDLRRRARPSCCSG